VIKLNKIPKLRHKFKEGVNMLTVKKKEEVDTVATKKEVLAALKVINEKYGKALSMLAK
jgi:hypothetical protein